MINPHRGEVAIKLVRASGEGADDLVLRPTFDAIVAVEEQLGTGMAEVIRRFHEGRYGMRDLAAIVFAGLEAAGHIERRDVVQSRVAETGMYELRAACLQWCINAWYGGQDPTTLPPMEAPATAATASPPGNGSASPAQP